MDYDTSPNLELVKTALDKLIDQEKLAVARTGKAEATDPAVFTQDRATNAAVVTTVLGGGGYFDKTTDDLAINRSVSVSAPTPKTTLIAEFKKDLPISKNFMADQQQSAVSRSVRQQAKTWSASRDRNAMTVYSGGFATVTTVDGAYLFSATHTDGDGGTVDNLMSGALADATLAASVNTLRRQKAQTGVIVGYEPDFLLTPSVLHKTGMEVAKSVLRQGTGNNDLNYFSEMFPGMKVVYSPHLDDSSTTAYFLGSAGHGVIRFVREDFNTTLVPWQYSESSDSFKYKMRAREEVDAIEFSGLVGSTGA
jgi:hypothetical protein